MASQEPIEKLIVRLEADARDLMTQADRAIDKVERRMNDLDRTGKRVGRFETLKKGLAALGPILSQLTVAFGLFSSALVQAFRMANQAVQELRIERSFYSLANAVGQSGQAILEAMRQASAGTIEGDRLMQEANRALQLNVARTPQEFERLVTSARSLARAVGMDTVQALNLLIESAGSGATRALRELGISMTDVNTIMRELAPQQFGKALEDLTAMQRRQVQTRAILEAAARAAERLGQAGEDSGDQFARLNVQVDDFKDELDKTALVMLSLMNSAGTGPGILNRLTEGAKAWQRILIQISALVMAINDTLTQAFGQTKTLYQILRQPLGQTGFELGREWGKKLFGGEEAAEEAGKSLGETFAESLTRNLADLEAKFADVLNPEAATGGAIPGPTIDEEPTEESTDEVKNMLGDYYADLADLTRDNQAELESLEQEHASRLTAINADLVKDLSKLDQETAERRTEIFEQARRDLADLEAETNARLADEQAGFNTEERRATEDHLREMRRLTEDYLFDLEDAVTARDARAVVDLQRRFALESQRREEDFGVQQGREREDFDTRLQEIRDNEARRRQEILDSQAQELQALMQHDAQRRAEIEASHAEQRQMELQNYAQRQAELQNGLTERLRAIARELADEEKLNAEGAQRILGVLARHFGAGGQIDQLMEDFRRRQAGRMTVDIQFEMTGLIEDRLRDALNRIPRFQHGGTVPGPIGRPQLAVVEGGERIMPVGGGGAPRRVHIEFSGSAPPGIRQNERDQIAAVLLDALRETGVMDG